MNEAVFSRAHLWVALAVLAVLGFANCIVFRSWEGAAMTSLGPFVALFDLGQDRFDWANVDASLLAAVAAVFALGIALQFLGRARHWESITRLLIWGACWVVWCISGGLAVFALMG